MEEIESVGVTGAGDEMIEVEIEEEIGNVNFLCICSANFVSFNSVIHILKIYL